MDPTDIANVEPYLTTIVNGGGSAVSIYIVYWMFKNYIPKLTQDFNAELKTEREEFAAELKIQREEFTTQLKQDRTYFIERAEADRLGFFDELQRQRGDFLVALEKVDDRQTNTIKMILGRDAT